MVFVRPFSLLLAATFLADSVSAFVVPRRGASLPVTGQAVVRPQQIVAKTSHLAASVSPVLPSKDPNVYFQKWIAEPADVGSVPSAALLLSKEHDSFVIQYRGTNIYTAEVEKRPILNLSVLKKIKIDGNFVTVDAGVTVGELAAKLSKSLSSDLKELFTALPAISERSIAEASLDGRFEKLREAVEEVHVVDKDGSIISKKLSDVIAKEDIVVNVVLSPQPRDSSKIVRRWYVRKLLDTKVPPYLQSDLPEDVKVMFYRFGAYASTTTDLVVFVDGDRDLSSNLPKDEWDEILVETPEQLWNLQNEVSERGGFGSLTESGVLDTSEINPSADDIFGVFDRRYENLQVWIEKDRIRAAFDAQYPPDVDDATRGLWKFNKKVPKTISLDVDKPKISAKEYKDVIMPTDTTRGSTLIEGFNGDIYDKKRENFQDKRYQYATSSYDNVMNPSLIVYPRDEESVSLAIKYATLPEFKEARKTLANPGGYPFKVIGRGGGHQYSGVSCDNAALIISMEYFNKTESHDVQLEGVTGPDGKPHTVTKEVNIGTGIKLKQFATFMKDEVGATIPHGECPSVGIGGHSQSGGYGHIARAFGLAIDYIYGFTIVLANGDIRTVNRDSPDQADKDLYWAVLGGSPGAFGVTTNLVFHPILDKDYPHSTGYKRSIIHTPERMQATIEILEDFINRAQEGDENAIDESIDLMMSLSSNSGNRFSDIPLIGDKLNQDRDSITPNLDVILFEMECRDKSDTKAYNQFMEIIETFEKNVIKKRDFVDLKNKVLDKVFQSMKPLDGKGHYKLSKMSYEFTRSPPTVTKSGRENRKPYRKICHGSRDKVKKGWSKAFADLLNDVVATDEDISCIFQVVVGGGAQTRLGKANLNSIAHRDAQLHGLVFDLFHGADEPAIKQADQFVNRFEMDVVREYMSTNPLTMAQWASHGDLDMSKKEVWEKYFDKPEIYHKLRRIKKEVDPDDVFHHRFSIPPAKD